MKNCNFLCVLAALLAIVMLTGCEEEEAQLQFDALSATESRNMRIDYYSVDPMHMPKSYYIETNRLASELTIQCNNAESLYFGALRKNQVVHFDTLENGLVDTRKIIFEDGDCKVSILNHNTLKFEFGEVPEIPFGPQDYTFSAYVPICSDKGGKTLTTVIDISRRFDLDTPVSQWR